MNSGFLFGIPCNLVREVNIPSHGLLTQVVRKQQGPKVQPKVLHDVAIP